MAKHDLIQTADSMWVDNRTAKRARAMRRNRKLNRK